jgi:acyl-CoA thioesterase-1
MARPSRFAPAIAALVLVVSVGGCQGEANNLPLSRQTSPPPAAAADRPAPLVLFLGDSLTAGLGLAQENAFPAQLSALLAAEGRPVHVVNAGVSGDTSSGGLRRLPWVLQQRPDVVVVALGANDGLRGTPVETTEANLRAILEGVERAGARPLLVGMRLPPNYGPDYVIPFEDLYPRLSRELGVPLVPFLLEGVGGVPSLNQDDGVHPTAEGHRRIAAVVLPQLRRVLDSLPPAPAAVIPTRSSPAACS